MQPLQTSLRHYAFLQGWIHGFTVFVASLELFFFHCAKDKQAIFSSHKLKKLVKKPEFKPD